MVCCVAELYNNALLSVLAQKTTNRVCLLGGAQTLQSQATTRGMVPTGLSF